MWEISLDEDREKGRIASTATKRRAAEDYARSMLPKVREAITEVRKTGRGESLNAIADWLTDQDGVFTSRGSDTFGAETVTRILYKTEIYIEDAANTEFSIARAIIMYKARLAGKRPDKAAIEDLARERDRVIEAGRALGRQLRLEE